MLAGKLQLEWELPSRLVGQDIREWILANGAFALKEGLVHFARCEDQAAHFYGSVGSRVLEGVIRAVESPYGSYKDTEFKITTLPNLLKCSYGTMDPDFLSTLKLTLSWICLAKRNEIRGCIALSKGFWLGHTFHLRPMAVVNWSGSGWTKTLGHALIVCLDHFIPKAPLLSTVFPLAHQLAGVHNPLQVDEGLIYHGGMTALVPIELRSDGSILWHFEEGWNSLLRVSDIQCMKRRWYQRRSWYQTLDFQLLQSAPALIR